MHKELNHQKPVVACTSDFAEEAIAERYTLRSIDEIELRLEVGNDFGSQAEVKQRCSNSTSPSIEASLTSSATAKG
jgi:hypothetical protein